MVKRELCFHVVVHYRAMEVVWWWWRGGGLPKGPHQIKWKKRRLKATLMQCNSCCLRKSAKLETYCSLLRCLCTVLPGDHLASVKQCGRHCAMCTLDFLRRTFDFCGWQSFLCLISHSSGANYADLPQFIPDKTGNVKKKQKQSPPACRRLSPEQELPDTEGLEK